MTLYETKKLYLEELGLLERYTYSEDFKELSPLDQSKIRDRISELEPFVEVLTNITGARKDKPRAVTMYTLDEEVIRVFKCEQDAVTYLGQGKNTSPLRRVLKYERLKYKGFLFRYVNSGISFYRDAKDKPDGKSKAVQQLRINKRTGTYSTPIREFSSITEAAKFINPDSISSASERISLCCQGIQDKYKGYGWKFKRDSLLNKNQK